MHLTLAFLGDTDPGQVSEVRSGLDGVGERHRPVTLTLTHFGCFPNCRRPRVLLVGVQDHNDATARLQQAVSAMLSPLGWPPDDRSFRAHLTLGRVRRGGLHYYQSELRPDGPRYTELHRAPLDL